MQAVSVESPPQMLERRLGPLDAAAIVISNVVGVGIFITPRIIAQAVPHPLAFLGVWFAGGLLAFIGAMAYAELGTLRPRSGGEYVYLREGFGSLAAFLTGWTSFVAGFAGAIAAGALGVSDYLGRFVPVAGDATPLFTVPLPIVPSLVFSPRTLVALAAIMGLALIHIRGLGPGRVVQNTLAALKVSALALFVALGLAIGRGDVAHLSAPAAGADFNLPLAFIVVMFAYSGWNAASYVAEEIREPGRNVPIALALGTGAVVLLYLGLNVVYLYAVPIAQIAQGAQSEIAMVAADALLGPVAARLLGALAVVVLVGSLSAMTVAGPRVYFAMARDRAFFPAAARVHPRFHTPWVAIAAQAAWSSLLVLTNTKDQLAEYTGFAVLLFSAFAVSSVFILRRRYPDEPRAFKAWGYPVAITVAAVAGRPGPSLWGAGIIAAGVPLYLILRWRTARA
jgi:APA family basic amino acid/polyamine antiporter